MSFPKHRMDLWDGATTRSLDEKCFGAADPPLPILSWLGACSHLQHVAVGNIWDLDRKGFIFWLLAVKKGKERKNRTATPWQDM